MASYSSTTRITGLNSGLDTDSLVEQLMSAESSKYKSLQRKSQKVTWQQEAYRSVISKLQTFQSKWFGSSQTSTNFRYSTAFKNFKSTVTSSDGSESSAITVNSSTTSANYKINVTQLAKNDVYMSRDTSGEKVVSSSKTASDIANTITDTTPLKFSLTLDGVSKNIEVKANDINGKNFTDVLNDKLKTAFGTDSSGNAKVSVDSSKTKLTFKVNVDSGKGHSLKVNEGSTREADTVTTDKLDLDSLKSGLTDTEKKKFTLTVNVDGTDQNVEVKIDKDTTESSLVTSINKALSDAKIDGLSVSLDTETNKTTDADGKETETKTYKLKFTNNSYDKDISVKSSGGLFNITDNKSMTHIGSLNDMGFENGQSTALNSVGSTAGSLIGSDNFKNGVFEMTINGTKVTLNKSDSVSTMMTKISTGTGVTMTYNSVTNAFKLSADEMGGSNAITFDTNGDIFKSALGLTNTQAAQDAIIEIDGVATTRASNTIDIDGLNITLNAETTSAVTVGTTYDSSAMVDKIKTFVEEYNTLITDLNTQVKQTRAKTGTKGNYSYYDPLLDDEKKEMSDDEIEKWEAKAKEGLLYNDSSITSLLSKMRSALYNKVTTSSGNEISLYNIGITTSSDYTDNGKLVIDEDKLKKAIEENGNDIQELFTQTDTGIADQMKKIIDGAVGTKGTLRTKAGIVGTASVNENTLSKQLTEISEQISKEKTRLENKESYYYTLFANMESAISNSNSQLDSLYSMLS